MSKNFGALGAIGLGALIGTTVALAIDTEGVGLWVLGALAGGTVSYLAHDYRVLWQTMKLVWASMPEGRAIGDAVSRFMSAVNATLECRRFWVYWGSVTLLSMTVMIWMFLPFIVSPPNGVVPTTISAGTTFLGLSLLSLGITFAFFDLGKGNDLSDRLMGLFRKTALYGNPLVLPVFLIVLACRFAPKVIRLIHSDERLAYFVYGSAGAAAGWFIGHGRLGETLLYQGFVSVNLRMTAPLAGAITGILLAVAVEVGMRYFSRAPLYRG